MISFDFSQQFISFSFHLSQVSILFFIRFFRSFINGPLLSSSIHFPLRCSLPRSLIFPHNTSSSTFSPVPSPFHPTTTPKGLSHNLLTTDSILFLLLSVAHYSLPPFVLVFFFLRPLVPFSLFLAQCPLLAQYTLLSSSLIHGFFLSLSLCLFLSLSSFIFSTIFLPHELLSLFVSFICHLKASETD